MSGVICDKCDEQVVVAPTSTEKSVKTRKRYGGRVETLGEQVKVRIGMTCDCTTYSLRNLDGAYIATSADNFPEHWVEVDNT